MTPRPSLLAVSTALALALLLPACGGSSNSDAVACTSNCPGSAPGSTPATTAALDVADVQRILAQAVGEAQARNVPRDDRGH